MNWSDLRAELHLEVERLRLLGDFVLVKQLPEEGLEKTTLVLTGDHRYRHNRNTGIRRGVVIAAGRGDRIFGAQCKECGMIEARTETAKKWKCSVCGGRLEFTGDSGRCDMYVNPGDEVLYPQTPANDIRLNGEIHSIIHEEQWIYAVLETAETQSITPDMISDETMEKMRDSMKVFIAS